MILMLQSMMQRVYQCFSSADQNLQKRLTYMTIVLKTDIAFLVSHISTLQLTKKHEVTKLYDNLKICQQKISDGEALIQRLEDLIIDLRQHTDKDWEDLRLVSQDVKQAVSEEMADLKAEMITKIKMCLET